VAVRLRYGDFPRKLIFKKSFSPISEEQSRMLKTTGWLPEIAAQ
jgi:hypothetical protein